MKKTATFLCLLAGLSLTAAIPLRNCVIYYEKNSPPSVKEAARELKYHIRLVTGLDLKTVTSPRHPMIALGDSPAARKAGVDLTGDAYETFRIRTVKGNLYIVGKDLPKDRLTPKGGKSYGTLYGCYHFLNKVMKIEWLLPGEKGMYYKPLGKNWNIPDLNIRYTPRFLYRNLHVCPNRKPEFIQWKRRHGLDQWYAGPEASSGDHTWHKIYPGPNTVYAKANKDCMTTFKENPEFFGATSAGRRMAPYSNFPLCLSNPALIKDASKRYVNLARWSKKNARYYYKYHNVGISPNDNSYCRCPDCSKQYSYYTEKELGAMLSSYRRVMSNTPLVLNYYKNVTEYVSSKLPNVRTVGLIYGAYEFAHGTKKMKMPKEFTALMAPLHTAYGPGRVYEPVNRTWHKWLNAWDGYFANKYYHGVEFWFRQNMGVPFPAFPAMMKDTFHTLVRKNFTGVFIYGLPSIGNGAPTNYLLMKMFWDPTQDPHKLFDDFCVKSYGQGGKYVKAIYDLAEKNIRQFMIDIKARMGYNMTPEMLQAAYGKDWVQFRKLFAKAHAAPKDANQKWRLQMLQENLKLLNYHLVKMGLAPEDERSPLFLSDKEYSANIAKRGPGGPWEGYVDAGFRNPYLDHAIVPVTKAEPVKLPVKRSPIWFVYCREFLIKAASEKVVVKIRQSAYNDPRTGKPYMDAIPNYILCDENGKRLLAGIASKNVISFPAQKGKLYYLTICPQTDYKYANRWQVVSCSSPYATGQRIQPNGMRLYFTEPNSRVYFHLRKGFKEFQMYCYEAWGAFTIYDPAGKKVASTTNRKGYHHFKVGDGKTELKSGWYTLELGNRSCGVFMLKGPDPFFVTDPANGLHVTADLEKLSRKAVKTY